MPEAAAPAAASAPGVNLPAGGEGPGPSGGPPDKPNSAAAPASTAEVEEPPQADPPAQLPPQPVAEALQPKPPAPLPQPEPLPAELTAVVPLTPELAERVRDVSWREGETPVPLEDLRYLTPRYIGFDGLPYTGEMIAHKSLAGELADIFEELYAAGFPIERICLVDDYGGDDDASMAAGNTSAFNTRLIAGTGRYSMHSYGAAVDINPLQNPYVLGGRALPEASAVYLDRAVPHPGIITADSAAYAAFTSRGWVWGGHWPNPDYQHFEKAIIP